MGALLPWETLTGRTELNRVHIHCNAVRWLEGLLPLGSVFILLFVLFLSCPPFFFILSSFQKTRSLESSNLERLRLSEGPRFGAGREEERKLGRWGRWRSGMDSKGATNKHAPGQLSRCLLVLARSVCHSCRSRSPSESLSWVGKPEDMEFT